MRGSKVESLGFRGYGFEDNTRADVRSLRAEIAIAVELRIYELTEIRKHGVMEVRMHGDTETRN